MNMTRDMQLLAENQPGHLVLFTAITVVLAELVAITELFKLFHQATTGTLVTINRAASILGGIYFLGVFGYLMPTAVIPLTLTGEWRGPADFIGIGSYLAGGCPAGFHGTA